MGSCRTIVVVRSDATYMGVRYQILLFVFGMRVNKIGYFASNLSVNLIYIYYLRLRFLINRSSPLRISEF